MRMLIWIAVIWTLTSSAHAGTALQLEQYQHPDGAISIFPNGTDIDPYFAGKALLVAHDAGLDVRAVALPWINWGLQHQRADGGFDRFCRRDDHWQACAAADADDSAAAVWMELLAKLAPSAGFPAAWMASIDLAQRLLRTLHDPSSHIYFIFANQPVGLLMDNAEVYTALLAVSALKQQAGDSGQALELSRQADVLANSIVRVFWQPCLQRLRVSTQRHARHGFYPDQVAELFPILAGLKIPGRDQGSFIKQWLGENQQHWFSQASTDFPWGLVAIAADKVGQRASVVCWQMLARGLRHGRHWNVLEEGVFQALEGKVQNLAANPSECSFGSNGKEDRLPPTPKNLSAQRTGFAKVELRWEPDNSGRTMGYEILRNDQSIGISGEPFFNDKNALAAKPDSYSVRAYDRSGRLSPPSTSAQISNPTDHFITVYLENDRQNIAIRYQTSDSAAASEAMMDRACPRYLAKTLNLGSDQAVAFSFRDKQGTLDANDGKQYRLGPGLFTIGQGAISNGLNPCLDVNAPSTPEALSQTSVTAATVGLGWSPAKDDTGIARYLIFRNGAEVAETAQPRFTDSCVAPLTTYHYRVRAVDTAENPSPMSNELIVTTLPQ